MHLRSPLIIIDEKLKDIEKNAPQDFLMALKGFAEEISKSENDAEKIKQLKAARAEYITKNLKFFEKIKKHIVSIVDELGMVDVKQVAFDMRQFHVVRRNNESMADYIKRIHQQAKTLEKKQQEIEEYVSKLRSHFEYIYDGVSDTFEQTKNQQLKLPLLWKHKSGEKYLALCEKLVGVYDACADKIDELKKQATDELLKLAPMKDNTIVVYVWYLKGVKPHSRKMFGLDSTGHVAIGMKNPGEAPVYLSFYPDKDPNAQPSFLGRMAKRFGLPSPDASKGYFGSLEEDLFRRFVSNDKLSYGHFEQIELSCEPGSKLELDKAIKLAENQLANPQEYNFYTENCSTVVVKILKEAGCPRVLPFPSYFEALPDSPGEVVSYAENLKIKQKEDHITTALTDYSSFQNRVIKRIALAKAKLENELYLVEKNHGIYNSESVDNKNDAKTALTQAIEQITVLEKDIKDATTNEALNDLLKKKIASDLSIKSDGNKKFQKNIIDTIINPTLGALKVLLPIDAQQKITQIIKTTIGNIDAPASKLTSDDTLNQNGLIFEYLNRQYRILMKLNLGDIVNEALDKPRNSSLIIANKIKNMISQVPHEIDEIIETSHAIYLKRLSTLITELRVKAPNAVELGALHDALMNPQLTSHEIALKLNAYYETHNIGAEDANALQPAVFQALLNKILKYKLDAAHIKDIYAFRDSYVSHLQDAFGAFNQYLYFDAHASYLENNEDNILFRLKKALNIDTSIPNLIDASDIASAAVKQFQRENPTTCVDVAANQLYTTLHNPVASLTYHQTVLNIGKIILNAKKWNFSIGSRNQLDELHYQALITATLQAFLHGRLTTSEFTVALKTAAKVSHLKHNKQMIDRIIESFELQTYLDDVEPKAETQIKTKVKNFKYIDIEYPNNAMISEDNATAFYDALPSHTSEEHLIESSYRFIMRSMHSMFSHPLYSIVMQSHGSIGVPEFNHAIGMGFDKNGKDQANQLLIKTYNRIITKCAKIPNSQELNSDTLTDGEKLFCDVYNYMAALTDILKHDYAISETEKKLASIKRLTKDGDFFHAKLAVFIEHIDAAVKVHQLQKWLVVEPMMTHVQNLQFDYNLQLKVTLSNLKSSNYEASAEPIDVAIKTIEKTPHLIEDHSNQLRQSQDSVHCLKQAHQGLKDQLEKIHSIHIENLPVNHQGTIQKAKNLCQTHLTQTMGSLNRLIYLEDTAMKKCLANFLEIPNWSHKSIHRILTEASAAAKEEAARFGYHHQQHYYKNQLIDLLKHFINGKVDEVEFHHQLSSFIEDHQPNFSLPGFHWMFAIFFRGETAHKYSEMPNLINFKKLFIDKFVSLEVNRGKSELTILPAITFSKKASEVIKEGKQEVTDNEIIFNLNSPSSKKQFSTVSQKSLKFEKAPAALSKKEISRLRELQIRIGKLLQRLLGKNPSKSSDKIRNQLAHNHFTKRQNELSELLGNEPPKPSYRLNS